MSPENGRALSRSLSCGSPTGQLRLDPSPYPDVLHRTPDRIWLRTVGWWGGLRGTSAHRRGRVLVVPLSAHTDTKSQTQGSITKIVLLSGTDSSDSIGSETGGNTDEDRRRPTPPTSVVTDLLPVSAGVDSICAFGLFLALRPCTGPAPSPTFSSLDARSGSRPRSLCGYLHGTPGRRGPRPRVSGPTARHTSTGI